MGSIIMPKISKEEIIKAVERYKRGETSQKAEAKKQGVSHQTFQDWIRRYETFGADGFENTENRKYPSTIKESAVKTYEELVDAVGQAIHYYNYQRCQHRLNCLAPMDYCSLLEAA